MIFVLKATIPGSVVHNRDLYASELVNAEIPVLGLADEVEGKEPGGQR